MPDEEDWRKEWIYEIKERSDPGGLNVDLKAYEILKERNAKFEKMVEREEVFNKIIAALEKKEWISPNWEPWANCDPKERKDLVFLCNLLSEFAPKSLGTLALVFQKTSPGRMFLVWDEKDPTHDPEFLDKLLATGDFAAKSNCSQGNVLTDTGKDLMERILKSEIHPNAGFALIETKIDSIAPREGNVIGCDCSSENNPHNNSD